VAASTSSVRYPTPLILLALPVPVSWIKKSHAPWCSYYALIVVCVALAPHVPHPVQVRASVRVR
jgi:hypothetical protein